jgi:hypothetical protein
LQARHGDVKEPLWLKAATRLLVDCGDFVEWRTGDGDLRLRLPDQPADPGLPLLAGIARVLIPSPLQDSYASTRVEIIFTGRDGEYLGPLTRDLTRDRMAIDQLYPDEVFKPLRMRGVELIQETIPTYHEFKDRHPGEPRGLLRRFSYALS